MITRSNATCSWNLAGEKIKTCLLWHIYLLVATVPLRPEILISVKVWRWWHKNVFGEILRHYLRLMCMYKIIFSGLPNFNLLNRLCGWIYTSEMQLFFNFHWFISWNASVVELTKRQNTRHKFQNCLSVVVNYR